jgi:hypothetical protein
MDKEANVENSPYTTEIFFDAEVGEIRRATLTLTSERSGTLQIVGADFFLILGGAKIRELLRVF